MEVLDGKNDLHKDEEDTADGKLLLRLLAAKHLLLEIAAIHVLEEQVLFVASAEAVDESDDVWVAEVLKDVGLSSESGVVIETLDKGEAATVVWLLMNGD